MPKTNCPACRAPVPFSKRAEARSTVTCPECDEEFTPPQLRAKALKKVVKAAEVYDPEEDEDTYKVGRPETAAADRDKSRHATAAARGAQEDAARLRELARENRRYWFDGPEVWLVIFAVGAGVGLPFGIWLARNWQSLGVAKVFWLVLLLLAVAAAAVGLGGSAWAWLRQNR